MQTTAHKAYSILVTWSSSPLMAAQPPNETRMMKFSQTTGRPTAQAAHSQITRQQTPEQQMNEKLEKFQMTLTDSM